LSIAGRPCGILRFCSPKYVTILGVLAVVSLIYGYGLNSNVRTGFPMQKVVIAYVFPQDRELQKDEVAASQLTRINYAFANIQDGRIVNGFRHDDQNLAKLVALKQRNPSLTVLVSVGGWEWSGNFSDVALTKASRDVFIASVTNYIERHQLDGLDIDWEYPGQAGSTNHFRREDKQNFTLLLKELRTSFRQQQRKLHRPLYLTIAAGASSSYLAHTEMDKVQRYIDTVNLMAYDYYEPGGQTGNHAPLFTDPDDPKKISADRSVHEFEKTGVPAEKIVLGVPFYGHQWAEVADVQHGLFQIGKQMPPGYTPYSVISTTMLNNGFDRYWDEASSVPYLYNPQRKIFVSYEDPESVALKSRYVVDQHLAGIMFWDYAGDPTGVLLNAIHAGLAQRAPADVP
jgi:chitinase